jgi:hypothetical protein
MANQTGVLVEQWVMTLALVIPALGRPASTPELARPKWSEIRLSTSSPVSCNHELSCSTRGSVVLG